MERMNRIFLDTSAYSEFKKGNEEVIDLIRRADELYVNPVVIGELLSGFDGGKWRRQNREELDEFLRHDAVTTVDIDAETAERYSFVRQRLKKRGTPIPSNDMWIAASTMQTGSCLVTADSDFENLSEVIPMRITGVKF
jgi:predicted nucleic acid-binding protein